MKCDGCGSAGHDTAVCQTKRVLEQAREISELKAKLERADGLFRSADLELNRSKVELGQALMALDGMRDERDGLNSELTEARNHLVREGMERDAAIRRAVPPAVAVWTPPAVLPVDEIAHAERKHCAGCDWLTPLDAEVVGVKTMASGSPRLEFTCPKCGARIVSGAVDQVEGN